MLILALGGVLVGFAFLVVSLVTENSSWAWGCIVACVAAGAVLAVDARRRRQVRSSTTPPPADTGPGGAHAVGAGGEDDAAVTQVIAVPDVRDEAPTTVLPLLAPHGVAAEPVPVAAEPEPAPAAVTATPEPQLAPPVESSAEPDEEDADAADALAVAGSAHDVLVVDEHPRFHVDGCTWLAGRTTMSLPAREAVELGFSPCSRCAPSRTLASLARA